MNDSFCRLELIYPSWLAWLVLVVGAAILILGLSRLATLVSSGKLTFPPSMEFSNIFPVFLFVSGLLGLAGGAAGLAALNHPPFARWAIGAVPIILAEADSPVSADFNNKPLGEINIDSGSAYYVIRLSPQARTVRISGAYKDALCDADLLNRICRNNDDKLSCVNDPAQKTLRICAKADEAACRNRTL